MTYSFETLRVVDLTTTVSGPHTTRLLADIGAEVIKIEAPGGDLMRTRSPLRNTVSAAYGQLNAGKKSVALDLKTSSGAEVLRELVRTADILVENFRPGVMQRLGLDYEALKAVKPDLIYCAISGYGQTGPAASQPAYAPTIHAASGHDLVQLSARQQADARPDACVVYTADVLAGAYAFGAIMTGLAVRDRTGKGTMIDVSMFESMLTLLLPNVQNAQFDTEAQRPPHPPLVARNGFILASFPSDRIFQALCAAIDRKDLSQDPRFACLRDREANWPALVEEIEIWSKEHTVAECQALFDTHGVPCSPYRTVKEALADPQLAHRDALAEVRDAAGAFRVVNPPFRISGARTTAGPEAMSFGQQTRAVLRSIGYTEERIDTLIQEKAVLAP